MSLGTLGSSLECRVRSDHLSRNVSPNPPQFHHPPSQRRQMVLKRRLFLPSPRVFLLLSRYPPSLTSFSTSLSSRHQPRVSLLLPFLFYSFCKCSLKTPYSWVRYRWPKHPMGNNCHRWIYRRTTEVHLHLSLSLLSYHGYIFLTPQHRSHFANSSTSTEGTGCVTLQRRRAEDNVYSEWTTTYNKYYSTSLSLDYDSNSHQQRHDT